MYLSDDFKQSIGIPDYANLQCNTLGLDSPEHCFDKRLFQTWGPVSYEFNALGYRHKDPKYYSGHEILAVGDSFTLGLGVNACDTWPEQLSRLLNYPVLNFSMNGASNDWIARKTSALLKYFKPKCVIIHYSFTHRRERSDTDWTDAERTLCEPTHSEQENFDNWQNNRHQLIKICKGIPLIHTAIVNWHTHSVPDVVVPKQIDRARDGFHYGPQTNLTFATSLLELL